MPPIVMLTLDPPPGAPAKVAAAGADNRAGARGGASSPRGEKSLGNGGTSTGHGDPGPPPSSSRRAAGAGAVADATEPEPDVGQEAHDSRQQHGDREENVITLDGRTLRRLVPPIERRLRDLDRHGELHLAGRHLLATLERGNSLGDLAIELQRPLGAPQLRAQRRALRPDHLALEERLGLDRLDRPRAPDAGSPRASASGSAAVDRPVALLSRAIWPSANWMPSVCQAEN